MLARKTRPPLGRLMLVTCLRALLQNISFIWEFWTRTFFLTGICYWENHDGTTYGTDGRSHKNLVIGNTENHQHIPYYFNLAFAKRPEEELYHGQKRSVSVKKFSRFGWISKVMAIFRKQLKEIHGKAHDWFRIPNENVLFDTLNMLDLLPNSHAPRI